MLVWCAKSAPAADSKRLSLVSHPTPWAGLARSIPAGLATGPWDLVALRESVSEPNRQRIPARQGSSRADAMGGKPLSVLLAAWPAAILERRGGRLSGQPPDVGHVGVVLYIGTAWSRVGTMAAAPNTARGSLFPSVYHTFPVAGSHSLGLPGESPGAPPRRTHQAFLSLSLVG